VTGAETLPVARVTELPTGAEESDWLVNPLWSRAGVGFLFGPPKSSKSWMGLELAVSVASNTPCLGRFPVEDPGAVLVYLAEDGLPQVRARITALCEHRSVAASGLDLRVVTAPSLRLDLQEDLARLRSTLERFRPRLLLLDPLIRMHRLNENRAEEVSGLLGNLRELQRTFDVAIVLVHHARKRTATSPGEALRGSGDLYAWVDSAAHLGKLEDGRLRLTLEHRAARTPPPMILELASRPDGSGTHLRVVGNEPALEEESPVNTLSARVLAALENRREPMTTTALRDQLRVRNDHLRRVIADLESQELVTRLGRAGWVLVAGSDGAKSTLPLG